MRKLTYLLLFLSFNTFAFNFISPFPRNVKNTCKLKWSDNDGKSTPFLIGHVNALIELKDKKGEPGEKAYIYFECKGKSRKLKRAPWYDFKNITTQCAGVRITGLNRSSLAHPWTFAIFPDDIKVKSTMKDNTIILAWEKASTFSIVNGHTFTWTMKSKLSGDTFSGSVTCK